MCDKVGIIIQARAGSKRYPRKILQPFCGEKSVLEYLIGRILSADIDIPVIVATTLNKEDDRVEEVVKSMVGINVFRGDADNVLYRYVECAELYGLNAVVRVCADNPFLDMFFLKSIINELCHGDVDYVSYYVGDTPAIKTHYGIWCEGFSLEAVKSLVWKITDLKYLEHVTNYLYENENIYKVKKIKSPDYIKKCEGVRLTFDTERDFDNLKKVCEQFDVENINTEILLEKICLDDDLIYSMKEEILINAK